jgi:hypothetical protein
MLTKEVAMNGVFATVVLLSGLAVSDPVELTMCDHVDLVELNHYYDDQGRVVFRQLIFYEWCSASGRFNIRDFCLVRENSQLPVRDHRRGMFSTRWNDDGTHRHVTADLMRCTHTHFDPEVLEREYLDKNKRRELPQLPALK